MENASPHQHFKKWSQKNQRSNVCCRYCCWWWRWSGDISLMFDWKPSGPKKSVNIDVFGASLANNNHASDAVFATDVLWGAPSICRIRFLRSATTHRAPTKVFFTFWLRHELGANSRVHFLGRAVSKSVPAVKCFSRFDFEIWLVHSRVPSLDGHPAKWLRSRRFSEPIFQPSGTAKNWENSVSLLSTYSLLSDCSQGCCCICP